MPLRRANFWVLPTLYRAFGFPFGGAVSVHSGQAQGVSNSKRLRDGIQPVRLTCSHGPRR
jgi:hypothetical protein